jgi:hypothetical protein
MDLAQNAGTKVWPGRDGAWFGSRSCSGCLWINTRPFHRSSVKSLYKSSFSNARWRTICIQSHSIMARIIIMGSLLLTAASANPISRDVANNTMASSFNDVRSTPEQLSQTSLTTPGNTFRRPQMDALLHKLHLRPPYRTSRLRLPCRRKHHNRLHQALLAHSARRRHTLQPRRAWWLRCRLCASRQR